MLPLMFFFLKKRQSRIELEHTTNTQNVTGNQNESRFQIFYIYIKEHISDNKHYILFYNNFSCSRSKIS